MGSSEGERERERERDGRETERQREREREPGTPGLATRDSLTRSAVGCYCRCGVGSSGSSSSGGRQRMQAVKREKRPTHTQRQHDSRRTEAAREEGRDSGCRCRDRLLTSHCDSSLPLPLWAIHCQRQSDTSSSSSSSSSADCGSRGARSPSHADCSLARFTQLHNRTTTRQEDTG